MVKAIVYTSETGHTRQYAELLGRETGLPVYDLKETGKLSRGSEIIYLGWLCAGTVKGYKKAEKRFCVQAVCGVGMSGGDSQLADIRKVNRIEQETPVFYLQGGFELEKLRGINRLMMSVMKKSVGKGLSEKKNRTFEEDAMLELMLHGGNLVKKENLQGMLEWLK